MRDHGGQAQQHFATLINQPEKPWLDCSTSLSPLGPPPWIDGIILNWRTLVTQYPTTDAQPMQLALAKAHNINPEQVLCGNGSTELMGLLLRAVRPLRGITSPPCWSGYEEACKASEIPHLQKTITYDYNQGDCPGDLHFLAHPNNPDGTLLCHQKFRKRALQNPQTWYLLDLAFEDFIEDSKNSPWWKEPWPGNVIRVKSLTKFFTLPGLRLGFLATGSDSRGKQLQKKLLSLCLPWQVNAMAQWCGERLYNDSSWNNLQRRESARLAKSLSDILQDCGWSAQVCPAWILASPPLSQSHKNAWQALLEIGICARLLSDSLRFGLLCDSDLNLFKERLDVLYLNTKGSERVLNRNKPAILVAGITSDSGKSVLTAGLCAVLRNEGAIPMPYKAQNMSNQAWVTPEGGEIGWSQAVQAFAAGQTPHVDMNPVLLKPGGSGRSHIIHRGLEIGAMDVHSYFTTFEQHRMVAIQALDSLGAKGDCIVLEGAGGIAETNLRHRDLSNREAPLHVNARTLLVGDIDRGGVFSALYGAWSCLDPVMRNQICGFAINRFRGDAALLENGIRELEERTAIPVLGVLPYEGNLGLGHEDSLSLREDQFPSVHSLALGVIRLPHISNVNDFSPLEHTSGVQLFYSQNPEKLSRAHALILPGTRNTIADLQWLKSTGIDQVVHSFYNQNKPIFAVCGGMQMLGSWVEDTSGAEMGYPTREIGLEIIPIYTQLLAKGKVVRPRRQLVNQRIRRYLPWLNNIIEVWGYEIHCGQSYNTGKNTNGISCLDGWVESHRGLWATYWHGILHQQRIAIQWAHWVANRSGISLSKDTPINDKTSVPSFLIPGLARIEKLVSCHLDWRRLLPNA